MAFIRRVFGAQLLDAATYVDVERDPGAAMRRDFHLGTVRRGAALRPPRCPPVSFSLAVGGRYDSGSCTVTVVPPEGGHSTVMRPSCASTKRLAVGSPSPLPRRLVVKNGVKILSRWSAGMPGP